MRRPEFTRRWVQQSPVEIANLVPISVYVAHLPVGIGSAIEILPIGFPLPSPMLSDLRFAFRLLAKSRGFTIVTLLTLGLCIGANTAIFSAVYTLMLKPLPFPEPERIVEIYNSY